MSNEEYDRILREKEAQYYSQAVQDKYRLPEEYYHPIRLPGLQLNYWLFLKTITDNKSS